MQLDATDDKIVWTLAKNGRIPIAQLAQEVGIAPSTCHARVQALHAAGVVESFHAHLDLDAIGLPVQALIMLRVRPLDRDELDALADRFVRLPQVINLYFLGSVENVVIHVACASRIQLRDFTTTYLNPEPAVISSQANLIFDHFYGSQHMSHLSGLDDMRRDIR